MATVITIRATIVVERPNDPPVIDEQPPSASNFLLGKPKRIPFGRAHDPDGDALSVVLSPAIPGFNAVISDGQIFLDWNGDGTAGTYSSVVEVSDGKE